MNLTDLTYKVLGIYNDVIDLCLWLIFLLASATGVIAYKEHPRLKVWSILLIFLSALIISTIIYGSTIEQLNIVVREETIDIDDYNGDPYKFIIASDLHVGQFLNTAKLPLFVNKVNNVEDAEYLLLLGDNVNQASTFLSNLDYLSKIEKKVIFIYGNHDYLNASPPVKLVEGLTEKIEDLEFTILDNKTAEIETNDSTLTIAGIKDLWSYEEDYSILDDVNKDDTVIFLSHNPDAVQDLDSSDYEDKVDLVLSGHTHGGEVRLPFIGPIGPIPTEIPRKYDKGYFNYNGIPLYITSGVGSTGTRIRLFNPPEIVVITIE